MIEKQGMLKLNNVGIYAGYDCANYNWIIRDDADNLKLDGKKYDTTTEPWTTRRLSVRPEMMDPSDQLDVNEENLR